MGALLVQELLHPPGDLALGAADEALFREPRERCVADRRDPPHRLELGRLLDRAQPLHEATRRNELEVAGGERLVARVRERPRLEGEPARQLLGQIAEKISVHLDELDAGHAPRRLRVAEVREQTNLLAVDHERRVRALETRQVAHVDGIADEERLVEALPQARDALRHCPSDRNSSASRYPCGPLPMIRFAATSASTEARRHSSRRSRSDRCTSTTGTGSSSSASRIA